MSEFEVPEFKDFNDFFTWVDKLQDKDIQAWKTKDWLAMYDKLSEMHRREHQLNHVNDKEKNNLKCSLIRLYRNYRLEPEDFKKMIEIGKEIGQTLAQEKLNFDLATINVSSETTETALKDIAVVIDRIVHSITSYTKTSTVLKDYNISGSKISITRDIKSLGETSNKDDNSSLIKIAPRYGLDCNVAVAVHESTHAHLQTRTESQKAVYHDQYIKPRNEFSQYFYVLLQYNQAYYISPEETANNTIVDKARSLLSSGVFTNKEFMLIMNKMHKGYSKQPIETHAEIIALAAEHYYRQATRQGSERTAMWLADCLGRPITAQYNDNNGIDLLYQTNDKSYFDNLLNVYIDKKVMEKVSVNYNETDKIYTISVPGDFNLRDSLKHTSNVRHISRYLAEYYAKAYFPSTVNYDDPSKVVLTYQHINPSIAQKYFYNNDYGKFSETVLQNIEIKPISEDSFTIAVPKNFILSRQIVLEMEKIEQRFQEWEKVVPSIKNALDANKIPVIICDHIPSGYDLSYLKNAELTINSIGDNVILPQNVIMKNIPDGLDLTTAQCVTISGNKANIGKNIKFPSTIVCGKVPAQADLSSASTLILKDNNYAEIGQEAKLPLQVIVASSHGSLDLHEVKEVIFDGIVPNMLCKFPPRIEMHNVFASSLPNVAVDITGKSSLCGISPQVSIDLDKCDLSRAEQVETGNCIITDNTRFPVNGTMVFRDAIKVTGQNNLSKVLQSDCSDVVYMEIPSQDLLKDKQYPQDIVICFSDTKKLCIIGDKALERLRQRMGDKIAAHIAKTVRIDQARSKLNPTPQHQVVSDNAEKQKTSSHPIDNSRIR